MTQPLYEQLLRSYFGKNAVLYTRTPSGKGVVNHVQNGTGQICCVCKTEIRSAFVRCQCVTDSRVTRSLSMCPHAAHIGCLLLSPGALLFAPHLTVLAGSVTNT